MEKTTYTITGNLDEIVHVVDLVRTEGRFLSDTPNVQEFSWTATEVDKGEADITVDSKIDPDEIAILTAEYTSLFVIESVDEQVQLLASGGVQEQVV